MNYLEQLETDTIIVKTEKTLYQLRVEIKLNLLLNSDWRNISNYLKFQQTMGK